MAGGIRLDAFWKGAPAGAGAFPHPGHAALPSGVRRFLEHAIAPGARLPAAVRLAMHGEIRLGRWFPFRADQVIRRDRGMIWRAAVRRGPFTIRGSDRVVDGEGALRWRLLGVIPVLRAAGPDVTRSAAGRLAAESVWLPSLLAADEVAWSEPEPGRLVARRRVQGHETALTLATGPAGELRSVELPRWGNPGGGAFRELPFGALVEREAAFGPCTIPTRLRAGWNFGSERFESDGEFFRVIVDGAVFR